MTTREDETPPWVIPVREPDPSVVSPSTAGLGQAVAVLVLGVVAFTAAMIFGAGVLVEDTEDADTTTRADAGIADDGGGTSGDTEVRSGAVAARATSTTDAAPTSASEPTSTTSPSTTSVPASSTTVAGTTAVGSVPPLSLSFDGGWIAQLTSIPEHAGVGRLEEAWEALRGDVPDAVVAVSDDWPSLRRGYWVLLHPGPFASSGQADAFCGRIDRECIPRQLGA